MNHPRTTTQILKLTTITTITHLPILLLLATLTFTLRSNVEFATNSLTSFIDHDPSIKSLLSRLHLTTSPPPTDLHRRRRRPFLQLTRVGTLDDDFFSGDDDLDHRFFGSGEMKSVNYSDLIVDGFGKFVVDNGIRVGEIVRENPRVAFKLVSSVSVGEKVGNSVGKLASSVTGDGTLAKSVEVVNYVDVDENLVKYVNTGEMLANSLSVDENVANSAVVDETLVKSVAVDEKLVDSVEKLASSVAVDEKSVKSVNSVSVDKNVASSVAVDEKFVESGNSVEKLYKSAAVDENLVNSDSLANSVVGDENAVNSVNGDEKLVNSVAVDENSVNSVAVDEKFVNYVEKLVNSVAVDEKLFKTFADEKFVKSVEEGIREEVSEGNELEMFLKRFEIEKNEMSALFILLGVLSASYGFAIFGFVVTYAWVLGIVFVVVVNDLLKGNKSLVRMLWEGSNLGLKRLSGFIVMRWAVRDALTQLLGVWFFGEIEDQYLFFKIFVRLKLMPFSVVSPWVKGFEREIYGFLLSWFLLDTLVSFVFAVDAWIAMVDTRKSVREVVKEGCHLLSLMLHPAINLKCLEGILCGSFARWVLSQLFGKLFASAFQSFMEVYFMVAWLLYYFSVKSIDAESSGVAFGHRELEQLLEDVR